jgi:hypothetical protein
MSETSPMSAFWMFDGPDPKIIVNQEISEANQNMIVTTVIQYAASLSAALHRISAKNPRPIMLITKLIKNKLCRLKVRRMRDLLRTAFAQKYKRPNTMRRHLHSHWLPDVQILSYLNYT